MKVIRLLKKAGLLMFLLLLSAGSLLATPTFNMDLRNDYLVSANVYEFDVYLLNTTAGCAEEFQLANVQFGINVPTTFRAGGTIAVSMVPGTSELVLAQQPTPVKFSFQNTRNCIIMTAMANPGVGGGTIISCTTPGTRVARVRLTNTVSFGLTDPMSLSWCFSATTCGYPTKVSAYVNGLATDISAFGTFTTGYLCNPAINKPVNSYNVTGTGSYCAGGTGLEVGLDGSETGVTYTMDPGAVVVSGTGSAISFGLQTEGTYTVTAGRNCTYISGPMTGSAVITLLPLPGSADPIAGDPSVPEGTMAEPYSCAVSTNAATYHWEYTGTGVTINGNDGPLPNVTLDFAMGATSGQLKVHGVNQCGSGIDSFFDIFVEPAGAPPLPFNVTGGGNYCEGGVGLPVGLDGSELGVSYQLYLNVITPVGSPLIGDGNPLDFGNQLEGDYFVKGTNSFGETWMTGNASITEDPLVTPTFAQLGPYCVGDIPGTLPGVSIEGIPGTWNPATISTASPGTTTYTFTPDPGQCATTATMDIVVNAWITPTFTQLGPYCVNDNPAPLPATSIEGYTGTWNPAVINTATPGTTTYTFTPDPEQGCITTATMDVVVNAWITPTFAQLGPYCVGDNPGTLPGLSIEGYTGTWNPAVISTAAAGSTDYTFTPDAGQGCITTAVMTVVVNAWVTPTFAQLGPYCVGETPAVLPGISIEGITGTWNPAVINTSAPGMTTYTFTPDPGQGCVTTATMDVVVVATSLTWTGAVNNSWHNAGNWMPAGVPLCCTDVIIPAGLANYPTLFDLGACHNIFIDMGATLIDNGYLTICGTADVKRCYTVANDLDWHLIGSPIGNGLSGIFKGRYLQNFAEPTNFWADIISEFDPLVPMTGYAMWCDDCDTCVNFVGALNMGMKQTNVTSLDVNLHGWNLLSNPFVASIDWNTVALPTPIFPSVWYLDALSGNYLFYNVTGGGSGSQYIPPTQGFFVRSAGPATLVFDNMNKSHMAGAMYYKADDNSVVVIEANGNNYKDQAWIRFNEQENAQFDGQTDVDKIIAVSNSKLPQIYTTLSDNRKLALNSMPQATTVPMGFTAVASGTFTITAPQTGLATKVTLEDLFNGTMTDLMTSSYTFTYTAGDQENRFLLHFNGVGVDNNQADIVNIYSSEKTAYVAIPANRTGDVKIMNMLGQEVKTGKLTNVLTKFNLSETGIYVVQATVNGKVYTQKVIIR